MGKIVNLGKGLTKEEKYDLMVTDVLCDKCRLILEEFLCEVTQGSGSEMFIFDDRLFEVACLR